MKNQTTQTTPQTYNGWANYETWNIALYIQNNAFLYKTAIACVEYHDPQIETPYIKFIRCQKNVEQFTTPDGVKWDDDCINHKEINAMMFDLLG